MTDKVEEMVYGSARDPAKEAQAARKKIKELKHEARPGEGEAETKGEGARELLYGVE